MKGTMLKVTRESVTPRHLTGVISATLLRLISLISSSPFESIPCKSSEFADTSTHTGNCFCCHRRTERIGHTEYNTTDDKQEAAKYADVSTSKKISEISDKWADGSNSKRIGGQQPVRNGGIDAEGDVI